jgi:hypothetical protein
MKAFISYSTKDKVHASTVKSILDRLVVESFLAHEDIRVSEEWQKRIFSELGLCDIFFPLLSKCFKESDWCGQETGIAITREAEVLVFPVSVDGTMPYAFLSPIQALNMKKLDPQTMLDTIGKKWPARVPELLLPTVEKVYGYRQAEAVIGPLEPYFQYFTAEQANSFAELATQNGQIWSACLCVERYLPKFLELNQTKLKPERYAALKYQVENQSRYRP